MGGLGGALQCSFPICTCGSCKKCHEEEEDEECDCHYLLADEGVAEGVERSKGSNGPIGVEHFKTLEVEEGKTATSVLLSNFPGVGANDKHSVAGAHGQTFSCVVDQAVGEAAGTR